MKQVIVFLTLLAATAIRFSSEALQTHACKPLPPQTTTRTTILRIGRGDKIVVGGRREYASVVMHEAATIIMAGMAMAFSAPPAALADTGWDGKTLQPCPTNSNCVSSSSKEPPNRYLSPLRILKDRPLAFENAVKDLQQEKGGANIQLVDILPSQYYLHLQVPGTAPNSLDDIELQFTDAGTVNIRCNAQVTLPYAPFCIKKNCINGAQDQRDRLENLAVKVLGLPFADAPQMKSSAKWTPIFFNADRVPDMMDDDDY